MVQICRERIRKTFGETRFANRSRNERTFGKHASPKIWCRAIRKHASSNRRKYERNKDTRFPQQKETQEKEGNTLPQQRKHERKKETRFPTEKTREEQGNLPPQQKETRFPTEKTRFPQQMETLEKEETHFPNRGNTRERRKHYVGLPFHSELTTAESCLT